MAIVVDSEHVSFYENGLRLAGPRLPRAITDCFGELQLGDAGLALSSLKFYPRALASNEIMDIFSSGQPLPELATGSGLN
eukprot:1027556-Rhodomonas_salina.1